MRQRGEAKSPGREVDWERGNLVLLQALYASACNLKRGVLI